jgi:hypothetical protein
MQSHANSSAATAPTGWAFRQVRDQAGRLGPHIVEYIDAHGDANAAAAPYAELSRLSDAELERRGMPRSGLHRLVFETLTRRRVETASAELGRTAEYRREIGAIQQRPAMLIPEGTWLA